MKQYKQLLNELPSKTVVFAFGRFNPPTTGHELLMKVVTRLAQQKRADHVVFASKSQDAKKNPLSIEKKMRYLKMMFPRVNFRAADNDVRTFIEASVFLYKLGYKNVIMVAGSDRYQTFNTTLNKYNGKKDRHGFYKFDTIEVISSGQRDPDDDKTPSGMSGTKMREHAAKGDLTSFKKGLPSTMREIDARRLMNDVRMGMNMPAVREEVNLVKDTLREQYFRGEVFNVGDFVEDDADIYQIVKRGSNHLLVKESSGELVSKWISDVKEVQMEEKGLTDKTVRKTDRIKVARMIAMMLGHTNPEQGSPEQIVNMGLRKVKTKALNPEALRLVSKILDLAKLYDIKYDKAMLPAKLKEEKLPTVKKVDKSKKDNISSDILTPSDFRKLKKMSEEKPEGETESDMDAKFEDSPAHTEVGGLMNPPYSVKDDNLRRQKVKYQTEATSGPQQAERSAKKIAKANLAAKHEGEKEALRKKQARETSQLNKEEKDDLKDACWKGYKAVGLKDKNGKKVPNCVPEEKVEEESPFQSAKKAVQKAVYKKEYDHAHAAMKKEKKSAADIAKRYLHVDARELQKKHDASMMRKEETEAEKNLRHRKDLDDLESSIRKSGSMDKDMQSHIDAKRKELTLKKEELGLDEAEKKIVKPNTKVKAAGDKEHEEVWKKHVKEDFTDEELNAIVEELTDDEIWDTILEDIDTDDLAFELEDGSFEDYEEELTEEQMVQLDEVLTRAGRIKARINMRKTAAKRKRALKIALKRRSTTTVANKRAKRLAIKKLKGRFLQGRNPNKLSASEKERIEKIVAKKKTLINRLALKMVPAVRKAEAYRMKKH